MIAGLIPVFDAAELGAWLSRAGYRPRFNIAPSQEHWVVRGRSERPILARARWGMRGADRRLIINARAESVSERPMFRGPFARSRCLVVAHGFYEWDRRGARPQPWWFDEPSGAGILFAGVLGPSPEPDGLERFSIVTVPANEDIAELHPRMPAIIEATNYQRWLFGSAMDAKALLVSAPSGSLRATAVSSRVNSLEHDDAACLEPPQTVQLSLLR